MHRKNLIGMNRKIENRGKKFNKIKIISIPIVLSILIYLLILIMLLMNSIKNNKWKKPY